MDLISRYPTYITAPNAFIRGGFYVFLFMYLCFLQLLLAKISAGMYDKYTKQ